MQLRSFQFRVLVTFSVAETKYPIKATSGREAVLFHSLKAEISMSGRAQCQGHKASGLHLWSEGREG